MKSAFGLALLLALPASPSAFASDGVPITIRDAVADKGRPEADTQRDAERKPTETMAFAGVQPHSTVIELMPGGVYLIIDHAAASDAPADVTSTLHRVRADTVKEEALAAGFVLDSQSDALRNAADAHDLKVFDPAIRGITDQFVLKFRRPLK